MSAKDQIKRIVDSFKREPQLKDKTDGMAEGLLLGAQLADDANELSKETDASFKALQREYTENGNGSQTTAEITVARDGELVLDDRLKRDFGNVNAQLAQKAGINYVDAILMDIAKGGPNSGPQGPFMSLASFNAYDFPDGRGGTWLVFDSSFGDGAHSFMWDSTNSKWKDLGVYQATGIADNTVDEEKTTFLNTTNLLKSSNIKIGYTTNTDYGEFNILENVSVAEQPIPIKKGETYISSAGTYRVALYNQSIGYVKTLSPVSSKAPLEFVAEIDGYVRPSFFNEFVQGYTFSEKNIGEMVGARYKEQPRYRSVDYGSIKPKSITTDLTDFVITGKNLFNKDRIIPNTLLRIYAPFAELDSGQPRATSGYFAGEQYIPLKRNVPYTLSNVRVWNLYTFDKILIKGENTGSNTATVTIRPEYECLLRISGSMTSLETVQVEEGENKTDYEPYYLEIPSLTGASDSQNVLSGKSVANAGDSIAAGESQTLRTYGKIIADKNIMNFQSWAEHGASIGEQDTRGKITDQIDSIIATGIQYDYVLIDGGTNDSQSPLGVITEGYSDELDKATVAGGLEYIFKTLRENLPKTKILFVRVHNMSSRTVSSQKKIGEQCIEVCKKWSIPFVDLFNEGQLNTNVPVMKSNYTLNGDGTHPTYEGYELFYVPPIEDKMRSI